MSRTYQEDPSGRRARRPRFGRGAFVALLGALALSAAGAREARAGAPSACLQTQ